MRSIRWRPCREYIKNLRAEKGEHAAYDAAQKLKKTVYSKEIGRIGRELAAIRVQRWRNGLVTPQRQRQSANRIYRAFVAALNWGRRAGYFSTDLPWSSVGEFPVGDEQREGYLSEGQRTALLSPAMPRRPLRSCGRNPHLRYCTPDLGNLLRGYFYTGTRPGELAKVRVKDLNRNEKSLTVISAKNKNGEAKPRAFYLYEPAAFSFFERMAQDKLPEAYLMTRSDGSSWMFANTGRPRYRDWARGIKAAIRRANEVLQQEEQISADIVAYSVRHVVITDLLSEDGIDQVAVEKITGTSEAMIRKHYYKVVEERLKKNHRDASISLNHRVGNASRACIAMRDRSESDVQVRKHKSSRKSVKRSNQFLARDLKTQRQALLLSNGLPSGIKLR